MRTLLNTTPRWIVALFLLMSGGIVFIGFAVLVQYLVPARALAL